MVKEWLNPIIYKESLLKQVFGTKDYTLFSNSLLLREMKNVRMQLISEINELMMLYWLTN